MPYQDDYDDDLDDDYPADDDEPELIPCPHCGEEIYEESERCPECGQYITANTDPWSDRPWWWVAMGLLGIFAVVGTLLLAAGFAP